MFGCKHKFEKVDQDGYQYCIHCGKASLPPVIPIPLCDHEWEELSGYSKSDRFSGVQTSLVFTYRCKKCVEMRKIDSDDLKTYDNEGGIRC